MKTNNIYLIYLTALIQSLIAAGGYDLGSCLGSGIKDSRIVLPSDEKIKDALFCWNTYLTEYAEKTSPSAVVYPLSDKEISSAVECASQYNLTVSVKSGGHSYEGYWLGKEKGVVIDLKLMNQVVVDKEKKTVKVEAGCLLGPLMAKLWKKDKGALPHGLQQVIGVGGHTLGGGYGLLSRKYGLLADRVIEMEVILADGKKVVASKETNPDLFFALRGAGAGSFGVVSSFTYSYVNPAASLKVARLKWNAGMNNFTTIFNSIMDYYTSNPSRGATMYVNFSAKGSISMGATFSDDTKEDQEESLKAMLNVLSTPDKQDIRDLDFIDSFLFYSGLGGDPDSANLEELEVTKPEIYQRYFKGKSGYFIARPPKEAIDKLAEIMVNHKKVGFFLLIDLQGGAILDTPNEDTSFSHRNTLASTQIAATHEDGLDLMNQVYKTLEPYLPQAYQNYIDRDEKKWLTKYYGDNVDKLILIKNKYDSKNVFNFERSIPLKKVS